MSRYLTPSKVTLLVLINLYCESVVPSSATIPLLSFIASYLVPGLQKSENGKHLKVEVTSNVNPSISDFKEALSSYESVKPGRSLWHLLLDKLWSINSLHSFHELFDGLNDLYVKRGRDNDEQPNKRIKLSGPSPLGLFVRRASLEFTRLQFHDAFRLWSSFIAFREETYDTYLKRGSGHAAVDENIECLGLGPEDALMKIAYGHLEDNSVREDFTSTDDVEKIIEFQLERLQRFGNRIPKEMKKRFRQMIGPMTNIPNRSYFVKFFDAWRAGDYSSSFEYLHRYFDYTMQSRDRVNYQYALLHMAILHADFGCFDEAISAINETIATARENQDMTCLNYSLSWLYYLSKAYPSKMHGAGYGGLINSEREGISFLKAKAKEGHLWSQLSSALLSEAVLVLSKGAGVPRAFECVYQSSHLNVVQDLADNTAAQHLTHSTIWSRLGLSELAYDYWNIPLKCYNERIPQERNVQAVANMAYALAATGRYDDALQLVGEVPQEAHRILKLHQTLTTYSGLIKIKRSLHRNHLSIAEYLLGQLKAGANKDTEVCYLIALLDIDYHVRLGSLSKAFEMIEDLAAQLQQQDSDLYQLIHLKVLKAHLFARCGKPERGFSIALRAASTAYQAKLLPVAWDAIGAISNVLIHLEEFEAARRLLDAVIFQAVEGGDFYLCARLYSLQADAYMAIAGRNRHVDARQSSLGVSTAEMYVDRAKEYYSKGNDVTGECEMLAKKGLIAKLRGDSKLAMDYAAAYMNVKDKAEAAAREMG